MVVLYRSCFWVYYFIHLACIRIFFRCSSGANGHRHGYYLPTCTRFSCALVVAVSTSISAKHGLLIRNRANFEGARGLNAVVFDKTGTLTEGDFGVTNIVSNEGYEENRVLNLAASLEQHSEHPIATGIVKSAKDKGLSPKEITDFESITGKGIQGNVDGKKVNVVSPGYVNDNNLSYDE